MQVKGYKVLGVPLGEDASSPFSSFLYVRQHSSKGEEDLPQGRTLFLANVPTRTGVDTGAYLKEAFARYGEVEEVRVKDEPDDDAAASYTSKCAIGFLVFRTSKGLKAVLSASGDASRLSPPSSDVLLPGYKPSKRQRKKQQQQQQQQQQGGEEDKASIAAATEEDVQQLVRRFRARLPQAKLLQEEVDSFMASFEAAEAEEERKRKEAATQPDADGFVTVSYGKKRRRGGGGGGGAGKEEANGGKKRGRSGSHKKKKKETELKNFYAHQMREAKREQLARLRTRFEEDKARIERMKAARKFKPFG